MDEGKSVKNRGALVLVWLSSAPDNNYISSEQHHRCAAILVSLQPGRVHRLGHCHAVAYDCHCAVVLLSFFTTAQCATMFPTTSLADTQSSNCQHG